MTPETVAGIGIVLAVFLGLMWWTLSYTQTPKRRRVVKQKSSVPLVEWSEMDEKAVEFGITEFTMPGSPDVRLRPVAGGFIVVHKGEKVARMVTDGDDLRIEGRVVHQIKLNIKSEV